MLNHGHALRALAEKYLRLAKTTDNARERSRFIDYAMLYAQLSEQARRRGRPAAATRANAWEERDAPRRYASRR